MSLEISNYEFLELNSVDQLFDELRGLIDKLNFLSNEVTNNPPNFEYKYNLKQRGEAIAGRIRTIRSILKARGIDPEQLTEKDLDLDKVVLRFVSFLKYQGNKVVANKKSDDQYEIYIEPTFGPNRVKLGVIYSSKDSISENELRAIGKALANQNTNLKYILTKDEIASSTKNAVINEFKLYEIQLQTIDEFYKSFYDIEHYKGNLIREINQEEIKKYTVPLNCTYNEQKNLELDTIVENWLQDKSKNLLLILGEIGSGKTWFVYKVIAEQIQLELSQRSRSRIPILINLREYQERMDLEYLITKRVSEHYDFRPTRGFKDNSHLNEQGCLLIILDGFDEMSLKLEGSTLRENLRQLMILATPPQSKVLLTSRTEVFYNKLYRRSKNTSELLFTSEEKSKTLLDYLDEWKIIKDVVEIEPFSNKQISDAISRRSGDFIRGQSIYQELTDPKRENIFGFAKKPLFIKMIVNKFEKLISKEHFDLVDVYEELVNELIKRDEEDGRRTLIDSSEREHLLKKLAYDFFRGDKIKSPISFEKLKEYVVEFMATPGAEQIVNGNELTMDLITRGPLVADSRNQYAFFHQIVERYLISKYLIDLWKNNSLEPIQIDNDIRGFLNRLCKKEPNLYQYEMHKYDAIKNMIFIPSGFFIFGDADELAIRYNHSFYIDKFPVTNKQYCDFLNKNLARENDWQKWIDLDESRLIKKSKVFLVSKEEYANHPVTGVKREGAIAYADWVKKELPTIYEWERAIRGIDGRIYRSGDETPKEKIPMYKSIDIDLNNLKTIPVDKLPQSVFECHDTTGHIFEWTISVDNRTPKPIYYLKGGVIIPSDKGYDRLRCDYIAGVDEPKATSKFFGFRCVLREKGKS
jgi:hypothetical protein